MATHVKSAALSNVGKIRSNNQDSGYAGTQLFVVADGMGGHAGGDVASAIAIQRIRETDRAYTSPGDAEFALQSSLIAANQLLAETVFEHQELTGMGTTVSALLRVGDSMAIAHIGDSRIYLYREGELSQITADHTFVQRLVDSGRITPEEAAVHPRRSVLMRVLGDVDAAPEIDTAILGTQPGDRWLICSDGLSSYLAEERVKKGLAAGLDADETARRLVKETLDHGAPDNVTVVIVDIDESGDSSVEPPVTVGSAATPLTFEGASGRRPLRLPTILLHPLKVATTPEDSHFEPESDEYLAELIAEDKRRRRRRRITWLVALVVAVGALVAGLVLTYQWTQDHYYVGEQNGTVVIYKGVQQSIGPIALSSVYEGTSIDVDDLPNYTQQSVKDTISANSLTEARAIVERLADASTQ
ncbi:PP2C family protein-serine/threonine phosphatase [Frigoribacterium sp. 2-23]|uniref:PP2C family protein-serine/threonine phosphatase n=1 Tax=Frigoribacterium sp. 2-23 TaxID=3415006 RepID=UPI003C6F0105